MSKVSWYVCAALIQNLRPTTLKARKQLSRKNADRSRFKIKLELSFITELVFENCAKH